MATIPVSEVVVSGDYPTRFPNEDGGNTFNGLAELPGTDDALRDEVGMSGGHVDLLARSMRGCSR